MLIVRDAPETPAAALACSAFVFDQDIFVTDEIDPVENRQQTIAIAHRQARFADKGNASLLELDGERLAIHRLQKATSELTMEPAPMIGRSVGR